MKADYNPVQPRRSNDTCRDKRKHGEQHDWN
jgi:hypothetical protein